MSSMNERSEVVDGLSVREARECLALIREEYLHHLPALHDLPDAPVGPNSPGLRLLSKVLPTLPEEMRQEWEQVLQWEGPQPIRNRAEHSVQVPRRQST
jgi:hypothetical protein